MEDKSLKNMPKIIMLSAFGREEVVKQAEKIGIKAFLIKPATQSLLLDTILNVSEVVSKDYSSMVQVSDKCKFTDNIDGIKVLLAEDNANESRSCKGDIEQRGRYCWHCK